MYPKVQNRFVKTVFHQERYVLFVNFGFIKLMKIVKRRANFVISFILTLCVNKQAVYLFLLESLYCESIIENLKEISKKKFWTHNEKLIFVKYKKPKEH